MSDSLADACAHYTEVLFAVTEPTRDGGRRITDQYGATALCSARDKLLAQFGPVFRELIDRHSTPYPNPISQGMKVLRPLADENVNLLASAVGHVWKLLSPSDRLWKSGDVISADVLASLESVRRLLALRDGDSLAAQLVENHVAGGSSGGAAPAAKVHPAMLAKAILFENPEISPTQLAERVGIKRSTLYKKTKPWKDVRAILLARGNAPSGSKDADGNLEAVDDDTSE